MPERIVMLVDLDYFFAQCEELRKPSLRSKPVVIGVYSGRTADSGAVSTANYIARNYGVKSGMPIFQAKKKLSNTESVFLPVDYTFYEEISTRVMNFLRVYADAFEQVGIDEAYLDVTHRVNADFEKAEQLSREIKDGLRSRVGLTCSIGVGPNKLVSKIAADRKKPDGLTIVKPEKVRSFLAPLAIDQLIGIGKKTREKMSTLGITTLDDLAGFDVQKLISVFGRNLGVYFHNASQGIDKEPVQERKQPESVSRICTLSENTREAKRIFEKASELCDEIQRTLKERNLTLRTIGIIAVMSDLSIHVKNRTLEAPTEDIEQMKRIVDDLFDEFLGETQLSVRRIGVKVSNLSQPSNHSLLTYFGDKERN